MELFNKNMDIFFKRFQIVDVVTAARAIPYHLPVQYVGYLPKKRQMVEATSMLAKCVSFNFILSGRGAYWRNGRKFDILAPCVFFFGDIGDARTKPQGQWEELYIVYPADSLPVLQASGYAQADRPVWPVKAVPRLQRLLNELHDLMGEIHLVGNVDRLDAVCETLVRETILGHAEAPGDDVYSRIMEIRNLLERECAGPVNLPAILKKVKMPGASFRRHWAKYFALPPMQYVQSLRIQHACHLLAESDLRINEIAGKLGFRDPLYFSRIFRAKTGKSPAEYRRRFIVHG